MGHSTYNMGIGHWMFGEEESTFRHQTFDFWDLRVVKKKLKSMRKNSQIHSERYYWTHLKCYSERYTENHLESNLESYFEIFLESLLEFIQKFMWIPLIWFVSWMRVKMTILPALKSYGWWVVVHWDFSVSAAPFLSELRLWE